MSNLQNWLLGAVSLILAVTLILGTIRSEAEDHDRNAPIGIVMQG